MQCRTPAAGRPGKTLSLTLQGHRRQHWGMWALCAWWECGHGPSIAAAHHAALHQRAAPATGSRLGQTLPAGCWSSHTAALQNCKGVTICGLLLLTIYQTQVKQTLAKPQWELSKIYIAIWSCTASRYWPLYTLCHCSMPHIANVKLQRRHGSTMHNQMQLPKDHRGCDQVGIDRIISPLSTLVMRMPIHACGTQAQLRPQ